MTLEEKIRIAYPDGVVRNISENHELYYQIRKVLPYVQYPSVKSYLRSLGFQVETGNEGEGLRKAIEKELNDSFPDGVVDAKDLAGTSLYYKLRKYNVLNKKIADILSDFGYTYIKSCASSQYDYASILRLSQEYIPNQRDLVRILEINRGTVNNIVNGKINMNASADSWQVSYLEDYEEELLMKCIIEKQYIAESNNIRLSIHNNGLGRVAIIIKDSNSDAVKVMFNEDIPDYLRRHMDRQGLTYLLDYENAFFSKAKYVFVLGKKYILSEGTQGREWSSIKNRGINARSISEDDYYKLVGVYGQKPYALCDDDVLEVLSRNADEDGTVAQTSKEICALNRHFRHYRFEIDDPEYRQFDNWEEYIESFGYHMRGVHGITPEIAERVKMRIDERNAKLLENHMVCGKRRMVYIPSRSTSYRYIYNACKTRGFDNMADYVEFLGFQLCSIRRENGNIVIAS